MGRPIETARKHARRNLAETLHGTAHVASRPADLSEAMKAQGKAQAIRSAVDAGLLPSTMLEVAELLAKGAHATRELAHLQRVAAVYCSDKQLGRLDETFPLWRPQEAQEPPRAPAPVEDPDLAARMFPASPEVERVQVRPNLHIPRAELEDMSLRDVAAKYGTTAGAVANACRRAGIVRGGAA